MDSSYTTYQQPIANPIITNAARQSDRQTFKIYVQSISIELTDV